MSDQIHDEPDPSRPLSVDYDSRCPSPHFTAEQIAYIESIDRYLDRDELEKLRNSERFVYNSIFGFYGVEVHGLRQDPRQGCVYVPRFSTLPYIEMMEKFTYKAYDYLDEDIQGRCGFPSYRLTCRDGKSFFPFIYHRDLEQWHRAIEITAEEMGIELARFNRCRLVVSTSLSYNIADIDIEMVQADEIPNTW